MKRQPYLDFIQEILTDEAEFQSFSHCYQQPIPKSIKIIESRIQRSALLAYLDAEKWTLDSAGLTGNGKHYDDLLLAQRPDQKTLGNHFLHEMGYYYIQEIAAGLPAQLMDLQPWELILDLCAAPGGKSVQIADQLLKLGSGFLLCNEVSNPRRKALIHNLNRCGMHNTAITAYDGTQIGDLAPESFDKILLDAPCSGEGMQYKHDKKVSYRDPKLAEQFAQTQKKLLHSALKALKIWGSLRYATCTLNPLENEGVIARALEQFPEQIALENIPLEQKSPGLDQWKNLTFFAPEEAQKLARFWPHLQGTGGFFIAQIRKIATISHQSSKDQRAHKVSEWDHSAALQTQVWDFLSQWWGIDIPNNYHFFASQQAIYVTSQEQSKIPSNLFIEKIWVPIIKISQRGEWIPQAGLASIFGYLAQKNVLSLDEQQASELFATKALASTAFPQSSFVLLQWKGSGYALAKQDRGILKLK